MADEVTAVSPVGRWGPVVVVEMLGHTVVEVSDGALSPRESIVETRYQ